MGIFNTLVLLYIPPFQVEGSDEQLQVEKNEELHGKLVKALQDIFELVTNDMVVHGDRLVNFEVMEPLLLLVRRNEQAKNLLNNSSHV